jgi:hypothetical protein
VVLTGPGPGFGLNARQLTHAGTGSTPPALDTLPPSSQEQALAAFQQQMSAMMSRSTQQFLASLRSQDTSATATTTASVATPPDFLQAAAGHTPGFMHSSLAPSTFLDYQASHRPVGLVPPSPPRQGPPRGLPLGRPVPDSDPETQDSFQPEELSSHYHPRYQDRDYHAHQRPEYRDRSSSRGRDLAFGPSPHRPRDTHRSVGATLGPGYSRDVNQALRALSYQSSRSSHSSSPGRGSSRRRRRRHRSSSGSASTLHRHRSRSRERGGGHAMPTRSP